MAMLSIEQLYAVLQLRSEVFVVEQQCVYQDLDGLDECAVHVLGQTSGSLIAYARILPPGTRFAEASIGRVICRADLRGSGLGRRLMDRAVQQCHQLHPASDIRISAQEYLRKFYQSLGFRPDSQVYLEDGIPHLEMLLAQ